MSPSQEVHDLVAWASCCNVKIWQLCHVFFLLQEESDRMATTSYHDLNHGFAMPPSQFVCHPVICYLLQCWRAVLPSLAVFRRCVISSQEDPFILLIALLSAFFLPLESMSSSVALPWYLLQCSLESITWLAVGYVVLYWYTVTDLTTLWPFHLFRVWTNSSATCNIVTTFFGWYEFVLSGYFLIFQMTHIILTCANGIGEDDLFEECEDELEEVESFWGQVTKQPGARNRCGVRLWNMTWTWSGMSKWSL